MTSGSSYRSLSQKRPPRPTGREALSIHREPRRQLRAEGWEAPQDHGTCRKRACRADLEERVVPGGGLEDGKADLGLHTVGKPPLPILVGGVQALLGLGRLVGMPRRRILAREDLAGIHRMADRFVPLSGVVYAHACRVLRLGCVFFVLQGFWCTVVRGKVLSRLLLHVYEFIP